MKNEERLFRYILSFLVTAILTFTFVPNIHHYLMPDGPITKTDKGGLSFRFNEICNKWSDKTLEKMNPFLQLFAIIILIILFFIA